jgi:Tol biopolymer transport system component
VAFASDADNLAYGPYTQTSVFVRDLTLGSYRVMSVNGATRANGYSGNPSISGDSACWVAFESDANNLVISGTYGVADTNGVRDILIKSCDGAGPYRVNVERQSPTQYLQAVAPSQNPVISRNAASVVFESNDTQLVGSPVITNPGTPQIYLADVNRFFTSGSILFRLSGATDYSNGSNVHPAISTDGT